MLAVTSAMLAHLARELPRSSLRATTSCSRTWIMLSMAEKTVAGSYNSTQQATSSTTSTGKRLEHGPRDIFVTLKALVEFTKRRWPKVGWIKYTFVNASPPARFGRLVSVVEPNLGTGLSITDRQISSKKKKSNGEMFYS